MDEPLTFPASIPCRSCMGALAAVPEQFEAHLAGRPQPCPGCKTADWWSQIRWALNDWSSPWTAPAVICGTQTSGKVRIDRGKSLILALTDWGVPEDAEILEISVTPYGPAEGAPLWPLHMHGNHIVQHRVPNSLVLFGTPLGESAPESGEAFLSVWWIAPGPHDASVQHLISAARHFIAGRYESIVVPANVAAETALGSVMLDWVNSFIGKDRARRFLSDGATYSYQLNVLLPILSHSISAPSLQNEIRGRLNDLRKLRNEIAHGGRTEAAVDKAAAADLFAAAAFGFHYSKILSRAIATSRQDGRVPFRRGDGAA